MSLKTYIIRRCLVLVPTLFGITIIVFVVTRLTPGGPVRTYYGMQPGITEEMIKSIEHAWGLDKPIYEQYFIWISQLLRGDLGNSFVTSRPVVAMIGERMLNTVELTLTALIVAVLISIPLGVISAVKQYSFFDHAAMVGALFGVSMPVFWMGLIAVLIFGLNLRWFPISGTETLGANFSSPIYMLVDRVRHLILPAAILALSSTAEITRLVRSSMLEVLNQDYLMTARMKGLKERLVIYKHALRNALLPVVTVVGLRAGYLFGGAVLVETVFSWPGLGRLIVSSALTRDYPVIMGVTVVIALMITVASLVTDLIYTLVDPRIKY